LEVIAISGAEIFDDGASRADVLRFGDERAGSFGGLFLLSGLELFLQIFLLGEEGFDFLFQFGHGRVDLAGESFDEVKLIAGLLVGFEAGDGFDAADAGGDGGFGDNAEEANGIKFTEYTTRALAKAIRKALVLYAEPDLLSHFRMNGMTADFSWKRTTEEYVRVYRNIVEQ